MKVIEISKKTTHKTEQMELVISILCFLNDIHLSKTDVTILSYFVVHGVKESTDNLLIESGVTKRDALRNTKSRLVRLGFMKRTKELYSSYELALDKNFVNDKSIRILIKIDNT